MFDLYRGNRSDTCHFVLGRAGARPLHVVGLNPSTANRDQADVTVAKVARMVSMSGFDGFVMLNLYPLRCLRPADLPRSADASLLTRNQQLIVATAKLHEAPQFWAAWGADICRRKFLIQACQQLADEVASLGGGWWCYGAAHGPLTRQGHPRHPSRLSYAGLLQRFDMRLYLSQLKRL